MTLDILIAACLTAIAILWPRRKPETPQQEWSALNELRHSARELHDHLGWRWLKSVQRAAEDAQREIVDRGRDE
jgi:hypothetical protein